MTGTAMTGVTLAIETSGFEGSIALRRDGAPLDDFALERRRHAQTLVSQVQTLLSRHQLVSSDVDLIAVSHGPGSFTGLRVGIVFAKTFAYALNCPLVAVDTLEAVALRAPSDVNRISVVSDAQREQLFVGDYRRSNTGDWVRETPIDIVDNDAWCRIVEAEDDSGFAVTGPGLRRVSDDLADSVRVLTDTEWNPHAAQIASIGERLARNEKFADASNLEPFYLRRSSAEDKRAAREGAR